MHYIYFLTRYQMGSAGIIQLYSISRSCQYLSMNQTLILILAICLLVNGELKKQAQQLPVKQLKLAQTYTFDLQAQQIAIWEIVYPDTISPQSNFYVTAQAPSENPLQQPFMTVVLGQTRLKKCLSANNQFSGICRVDGSEIDPKKKLYITAQCVTACHLKVTAVLSSALRITTDTNMLISASKDSTEQFEFAVEIPAQLNFTSLAFFAQVKSMGESGQGGLQLYANTGSKNVAVPTSDKYDILGESIFWGGRGLYFDDQDFGENNNWIKIFMVLSAGMQVNIYWQKVIGNDFIVKLEETHFDFTTKDVSKMYYLQLAQDLDKIKGKTVSIGFVVYAGMPQIQVAFNEDFSDAFNGKESFGTVTFLITEHMRQWQNFTDTIYIRVSSTWNADYYFYTTLVDFNSIMVTEGFTYFNQIGQTEVFNYFYQDSLYIDTQSSENITTIRKFVIKVDALVGRGTFGVRRCKALEDGQSFDSCTLNRTTELKNKQLLKDFQDINVVVKKADSYYQIIFSYDFSKCKKYDSPTSTIITYFCAFHALGAAEIVPILDYTWKIQKRAYSARLTEGELVKQAIFEGQPLYYKFGLREKNKVTEVEFFITVMEGDVFMVGSTTEAYPNLDSEGSVKISGSHRLTFSKDQIADTFYLSVIGMEFSEYTIGVVVSRSQPINDIISNQTDSNSTIVPVAPTKSKIQLQLGLSHKHTLKVNDTFASFSIKAYEHSTITIQIVELVGKVKMNVTNADGTAALCLAKSSASQAIGCDLILKKGTQLDITVTGDASSQQRFSILYYKDNTCVNYGVNLPLYSELSPGEKDCYRYSVSKLGDFELVTSASLDLLLNGALQISICFDKFCETKLASHHEKISKQFIQSFCIVNENHQQSCPIEITVINKGNEDVEYHMVFRDTTRDLSLFDGVSQKIMIEGTSIERNKQVYFGVYSQNSIRIFFTAITSDTFIIFGQFVEEKDFLANPQQAYLKYSSQYSEKNQTDYYKFAKYGAGSALFVVSTQNIKKHCEKCIFTMNIYTLSKAQQYFSSIFEIQVSQQQTSLSVGQTKKGYLQKQQTLLYLLDQPKTDDAVITIKDLNKQSTTQRSCFMITLDDEKWSSDQTMIISRGSHKLSLLIKSIASVCNYEVSYTSVTTPVTIAIKNNVYSYTIRPSSVSYYLYNHNYESSFKIVQMLTSGKIKIAINRLINTLSLKALAGQDPSKFQMQFDQNQGEIYLTNSSQYFCKGCSYLIAISSQNGAIGQFVILGTTATVPLSVNGIIKQKIIVNETKTRRYMFQSLVDFNISITVIYGRLKIMVSDANRKKVAEQQVSSSTVLQIAHMQGSQRYALNYDSTQTTFIIDVESDQDSQFTIKASKLSISQRLFEGVGTYIDMLESEPYVLEFFNLKVKQTGNSNQTGIFILIEIMNIPETMSSLPEIDLKAKIIEQNSPDRLPREVQLLNRTQSDAVISIELPLMRGDYYINMTSSANISINVVMVTQSLIHLRPRKNVLMNRPQTFQLYSPNMSVLLQIFSCIGDLSVFAVDNYQQFNESSNPSVGDIVLEQDNYGGHYVVSSSEAISGQYFIKVNNKAIDSQLQYLLYYYYYDQSQSQPYKMVEMRSSEISYQLTEDGINFKIEPIETKLDRFSNIKSLKIDYKFYISSVKYHVKRYANCRSSEVLVQEPTIKQPTTVQFLLKNDNDKQLGDVYFVGAEAIVGITLKDYSTSVNYPSELNLIYSIIEITNSKLPPFAPSDSYSGKTVLALMLIPFILAGLVLYFSVRFCIRKYRGMVPDDLVEEQKQGVDSEQAVNKQSDQV